MAGTMLIEVAKNLAKKGYVEVVKRASDGTIQQILKVSAKKVVESSLGNMAGVVLANSPAMAVSAIGDIASTCILKKAINNVGDKVDTVNTGVNLLNGKVDKMDLKLDSISDGINVLSNKLNGMDLKLDGITNGITSLKNSLLTMDTKLDGITAGISGVSDQVRNVAANISLLQNSVNMIAGMNVLMLGLEATNLVVTASGFSTLNTKLDGIIDSISQIQASLKKIAKKQELDIVKEFKEVKEDYADMLDATKRGTPYNERQYYTLTRRLHSMIDYLYICFMSDAVENREVILEAIYVLLPMYANVLRRYDAEYYFEYKNEISGGSVWHNQHKNWMKTFDALIDKKYLDKYQDYCFLDENMSGREADDAMLTAYLTAINSATVVDDNQKILLCFERKEDYKQFQGELVEDATETIQETMNEYDEEIIMLINPSFQSAVSELSASL